MSSRLVVMASGSGTNLQAIIDACATGRLNAEVVALVANRIDAYAIERARSAGIETEVCVLASNRDANSDRDMARAAFDSELATVVASHRPDLVILAGWMHLLSSDFLDRFPAMVVNLHPALPGMFPGAHAIEDAWESHLADGLDHTGVMVHLVPDEGVDSGPVVASRRLDILDSDTRASLEARIHELEHVLFIEAIEELIGRPQ